MKSGARREAVFWSAFSRYYDRFIKITCNHQYQKMLRLLRAELDAGKTVLDVGAGTGDIALQIAPAVKKIAVCDISPRMLEIARHKAATAQIANAVFSVQNVYALDYPAESFDLVLACNILHVLPEPGRALASIKRVLKKDGLLIAPTYCHGQNAASRLVSRVMSLAGFRAYSRWSAKTFQDYLRENGFPILRSALFSSTPPLLYVVCGRDPKSSQ